MSCRCFALLIPKTDTTSFWEMEEMDGKTLCSAARLQREVGAGPGMLRREKSRRGLCVGGREAGERRK